MVHGNAGPQTRPILGAQTYETPTDLNLNARAFGGGVGGIDSDVISLEGFASFTIYFLNNNIASDIFVVTFAEDDVTVLTTQLLANGPAQVPWNEQSWGGTGNLPAQVWRLARIRVSGAAEGVITARLFKRS